MCIKCQLTSREAVAIAVAVHHAMNEGALKRIPKPLEHPELTYFSENDIWIFDTEAIRTTGVGPCRLCDTADRISRFRGNNLRMNFPNLVILGQNTIGGPEADGGGLVHPHCRCLLVRLIGEE